MVQDYSSRRGSLALRGMRRLAFLAMAFSAMAAQAASADDLAAQLQAITQEMSDAIAAGDKAVWDKYLDPDALYVDENNVVMTKTRYLEELKPLPPGYSGTIRVVEYRVQPYPVTAPTTAVATYVQDETENVQGHLLHNRYRETDVWRKTAEGWRMIASQVLAIPKDPPETKLTPAELAEYAGVYILSEATRDTIRASDGALSAERTGRAPRILKAEVRDVFFTPGRPRERRIFTRNAAGTITGFVDRREGEDLDWRRE
jgi:hypothetical protein